MHQGTKMQYHEGATLIEIPPITFLKPNEISKQITDLENICPYFEIVQNKKEFIVVK